MPGLTEQEKAALKHRYHNAYSQANYIGNMMLKDAFVHGGGILLTIIIIIALIMCSANAETTVKAGDVITLGNYQQKAETFYGLPLSPEPIEWIVLETAENYALVISKYGLDAQPYNTAYTDVTWETCTLRTWLNNYFLNTAFTTDEQKAIMTATVDNSESQCFDFNTVTDVNKTTGGNNTQDKIFLLSYEEANKYFGVEWYENDGAKDNVNARVQPTAYAIAQGAYTKDDCTTVNGVAAGEWWLRSPGYYQNRATRVYYDGSIFSLDVNFTHSCVRPALVLDLSLLNL